MTLPLFDRPTISNVEPPKARPYQGRGIQKLRDAIRVGKRRIILVLPTAGGKMFIIASIIRTSSVPTLFVCHRQELIDQCVNELARLGVHDVGVIRGKDDRTDPNARHQVASIQTLGRRNKPKAGLVIIDECHRAMSDIYDALIDHYRNDAFILGFTATPTRLDGRPLGNVFDHMEIVSTYEELIKQGYIVAPDCYGAPETVDLSNVATKHGDFDEGALGEIMRKQSLIGNLVTEHQRLAKGRRTFIFASTIQHSYDICQRFTEAGVKIAHLDGKTSDSERRTIFQALGTGQLDAISNVNIALEGTDVPSAKCVVHARPTQSLVLWRQSTGRVFRPWHPDCAPGCVAHPSVKPIVLDHAGNIFRHGFPHEDIHWTLAGARRIHGNVPIRICKACYAYMPASVRDKCPYCGVELPKPDPSKAGSPNETDQQLIQLPDTPEDMQRMYFFDQLRFARQKGWKPGAAAARFKTHYGQWPPWAWSESAMASFASDPEWQEAVEANQAKREAREASKKVDEVAEERAAIEEEAAGGYVADEGDAPFDSWLNEEGIK